MKTVMLTVKKDDLLRSSPVTENSPMESVVGELSTSVTCTNGHMGLRGPVRTTSRDRDTRVGRSGETVTFSIYGRRHGWFETLLYRRCRRVLKGVTRPWDNYDPSN